MKSLFLLWILSPWLLSTASAYGQQYTGQLTDAEQPSESSRTPIMELLSTELAWDSVQKEAAYQQLERLAEKVGKKARKKTHPQRVLQLIFWEGRKQLLHSYDKNYPHFNSLFTNGSYNCVTGTALYTWLLQRLGYPVQIHETAFHAYLTVKTPNQVFLLDATDPEYGFVTGAAAVGKRELWYTGNELRQGVNFHRLITFQQLCGLQYFNQGVVSFNQRNYETSLLYLEKALALYPASERILSLKEVVQQGQKQIMTAHTSRQAVASDSHSNAPK